MRPEFTLDEVFEYLNYADLVQFLGVIPGSAAWHQIPTPIEVGVEFKGDPAVGPYLVKMAVAAGYVPNDRVDNMTVRHLTRYSDQMMDDEFIPFIVSRLRLVA